MPLLFKMIIFFLGITCSVWLTWNSNITALNMFNKPHSFQLKGQNVFIILQIHLLKTYFMVVNNVICSANRFMTKLEICY